MISLREILLTTQHARDESILYSVDSQLSYIREIFRHEKNEKLPITYVSFLFCFHMVWVFLVVSAYLGLEQNSILYTLAKQHATLGKPSHFWEKIQKSFEPNVNWTKSELNICLWTELCFSYTAFKLPAVSCLNKDPRRAIIMCYHALIFYCIYCKSNVRYVLSQL